VGRNSGQGNINVIFGDNLLQKCEVINSAFALFSGVVPDFPRDCRIHQMRRLKGLAASKPGLAGVLKPVPWRSSNDAAEALFQLPQGELNPGGTTVGTKRGILAGVELLQQGRDFGLRKAMAPPDGAVAGH
jgi:hypothetical protein